MEQNVSLESLVSRHLNWMAERHYSEKSLKKVRSNLMISWTGVTSDLQRREITPTLLKHYQRFCISSRMIKADASALVISGIN